MENKIIADIRLFKSDSQNEYGGYNTESFGDKKLNAIVHRIVMKLREENFSFGNFDHLYINFTICDVSENIKLSDNVDRYHPWYRYCDIHIDDKSFQKLGNSEALDDIIHWLSTVLVTCFSSETFNESDILSCIHQAVEQGENMAMEFKEKITAKRKAVIYLRFLDSCKYYPLLKVFDKEDNLLFKTDLPKTIELDYLGNIQVSEKRVTIKPRKNALTTNINPMIFDY